MPAYAMAWRWVCTTCGLDSVDTTHYETGDDYISKADAEQGLREHKAREHPPRKTKDGEPRG